MFGKLLFGKLLFGKLLMINLTKNSIIVISPRQLVDKNEVHCCQIAVEGIVYEDEYVTDHQNILKKHHWLKDIKKEICNSFCVL